MPRVALAGLVFLCVSSAPLFADQTCQGLMSLALEHASITSASDVPEGPVSGGGRGGAPLTGPMIAPAHCAVQGIIRPTKDSEIHFELWIPASGWNGKYLQLGNGGWAGSINRAGLAEPVKRGYAAAATDDGHQGGAGATWAIGHPEKLIDFGYRAVHASDWSHLFTGFLWNARALTETPASAIPPAKLKVIQKAALTECDAADGVKDGLLQNPRACHFNPSVLICKGAEGPECLTAPQVEALRKIYDGPKNPRTGASIFPG